MTVYNSKLHPMFIQFRVSTLWSGASERSVKIDCISSQVILTETDDHNKTAENMIFCVSETRMNELLSFLNRDKIKDYEMMPETQRWELECGGRDGWRLNYVVGYQNEPLSSGCLDLIIPEDPLEMVVEWLERYYPKSHKYLYP